mmetsp:Transcript_13853/g.24076  ORF Transcript_13853/g.24076 Transcript_13853/m.24076 type:complete len:803 (+) Transcript_13853:268-2676(+)
MIRPPSHPAFLALLWTFGMLALPSQGLEQIPVKNHEIEDQSQRSSEQLTLGMVSGDSQFFDPIRVGWLNECAERNITCHYLPVNYTYYFENQADDYIHPCVPLMLDLIDMGVDGISAACKFEDVTPWMKAHQAGIPLVAFDSKPPEGFPVPLEAYVGTDQNFLGRTMARLLKQLKPAGGNFGIVGTPAFADRIEGFRDEIFKDNDREDRAHWEEVEMEIESYDLENDIDQFHWFMDLLAEKNPTAMIFMYQTPMRAENYTQFVEKHRHRQIVYIGTDGSQYQLEYLERRYVDGLVGQLPYDMGAFSAEILQKAAMKRKVQTVDSQEVTDHTSEEIILDAPVIAHVPTNLVAYNLIPIELPPLEVDQSLLGPLVIAGYICFVILALASILSIFWTLWNRDGTVVKASQPAFLIMTAFGILLMASALIPLSYDDGGTPETMNESFAVGVCMSIPWLVFTGFTCTFAALFSKTWRVNKFFHSKAAFGRLKVSEYDVIAPFVILISLNFIVLICWTVIDPLTYERNFELGTDYWNREIASVGRCQSEHAIAYLVPLAVLNFFSLVIAAWQAWQIVIQYSYSKMTDSEQRKMLTVSVRRSAYHSSCARGPDGKPSSEFSSQRISGLDLNCGSGHLPSGPMGLGSGYLRQGSGGNARRGSGLADHGNGKSPRRISRCKEKELDDSVQGFMLTGRMKLPSSSDSNNRSSELVEECSSNGIACMEGHSGEIGTRTVGTQKIPEEGSFRSDRHSTEIVFVPESDSDIEPSSEKSSCAEEVEVKADPSLTGVPSNGKVACTEEKLLGNRNNQ